MCTCMCVCALTGAHVWGTCAHSPALCFSHREGRVQHPRPHRQQPAPALPHQEQAPLLFPRVGGAAAAAAQVRAPCIGWAGLAFLGAGHSTGARRRGTGSQLPSAENVGMRHFRHLPCYTLSACREMLKDPIVRSKLISPPTNFNHLVHVGPKDKRPNARDQPPVSPLELITSLLGEAEPITGLSSAFELIGDLCLPGTLALSASRAGGWPWLVVTCCVAPARALHTVPQQASEVKGRGARGSGPQRPHSFSEASRRPASTGSDGNADPSKDGPPAHSTSMCLPQVSTHFGPLKSDLEFLSSHPAPGTVKRKPWTSLSSESVSCPQGSLSPTASLIQVSRGGFSLPHSKLSCIRPFSGPEAKE